MSVSGDATHYYERSGEVLLARSAYLVVEPQRLLFVPKLQPRKIALSLVATLGASAERIQSRSPWAKGKPLYFCSPRQHNKSPFIVLDSDASTVLDRRTDGTKVVKRRYCVPTMQVSHQPATYSAAEQDLETGESGQEAFPAAPLPRTAPLAGDRGKISTTCTEHPSHQQEEPTLLYFTFIMLFAAEPQCPYVARVGSTGARRLKQNTLETG